MRIQSRTPVPVHAMPLRLRAPENHDPAGYDPESCDPTTHAVRRPTEGREFAEAGCQEAKVWRGNEWRGENPESHTGVSPRSALRLRVLETTTQQFTSQSPATQQPTQCEDPPEAESSQRRDAKKQKSGEATSGEVSIQGRTNTGAAY